MGAAESYQIASVGRSEVLRYLGYGGQALSDELEARLDAGISRCLAVGRPRGVTRVFDVAERGGAGGEAGDRRGILSQKTGQNGVFSGQNAPSADGDPVERVEKDGGAGEKDGGPAPVVRLVGTALELRGHSIAAHLDGAVAVGVLVVTAGMGVDAELRRLSLTDPVGQVVLDAAGSALVERAADAAEASLVAQAAERGLVCGARFSPGYGDLPLDTQPVLLAALDAQRRLGVTLSSSLLMTPTKSVTAVVGLFERAAVPDARPTCATCCCREFCALRAAGRTCRG